MNNNNILELTTVQFLFTNGKNPKFRYPVFYHQVMFEIGLAISETNPDPYNRNLDPEPYQNDTDTEDCCKVCDFAPETLEPIVKYEMVNVRVAKFAEHTVVYVTQRIFLRPTCT